MNDKLVLIVDDNSDIRQIYQMKFQVEGFQTIVATNGKEALEMIQAKHPDVVLLDIQMPEMDGLQVLERLRSDEKLKSIPVVVLSNIDNNETFQRVSDLKAADYYLIKSLVDPQKVVDVTIEALAASEDPKD
jgi:CheY-like chemotaxis protein